MRDADVHQMATRVADFSTGQRAAFQRLLADLINQHDPGSAGEPDDVTVGAPRWSRATRDLVGYAQMDRSCSQVRSPRATDEEDSVDGPGTPTEPGAGGHTAMSWPRSASSQSARRSSAARIAPVRYSLRHVRFFRNEPTRPGRGVGSVRRGTSMVASSQQRLLSGKGGQLVTTSGEAELRTELGISWAVGAEPPIEARELCRLVGAHLGKPIDVAGRPIPTASGAGAAMAVGEGYLVLYQAATDRVHQAHIILHELVHIVRGHLEREATGDLTCRFTDVGDSPGPLRPCSPDHGVGGRDRRGHPGRVERRRSGALGPGRP